MRLLFQQHTQEEDWGFLIIDVNNAFYEENRSAMLWATRHEWPSGVRCSFNCYRHWDTMVITAGYGTGHFLHSKEGVTQGDTLSMIVYGLVISPLIQDLRMAHPGVTQP